MCGIFGWALPRGAALKKQELIELTDQLAHRGPDGAGYWVSEDGSGWQMALGHRRLAIIDLSVTGAQPMIGDDGSSVLIFNGEIYNYSELRLRLLPNEVFQGDSDTEVLMRLLMRYGQNIIPQLRGMFSFAFWSEEKGTLLLARDHFGKKPLYIANMINGGIAFASELHSLLNMPGVSNQLDVTSVPEYLQLRYVPSPNTLFTNIKKLPPGNFAVFKEGAILQHRFYTPPYISKQPELTSWNDAERKFADSLRTAVKVRLRSDAPFGAFLSGGIDSAAVLALMRDELGDNIKTFSAGFDEAGYSELSDARKTSKFYRTDHTEIVVGPQDVMDNLREAVRHRGAPVSEPSDIAIMLLSKVASKSVKMVLTGEGSDELLAGYPKHKIDPLISRYQKLAPAKLHVALTKLLQSYLPGSIHKLDLLLKVAEEKNARERWGVWFGGTSTTDRLALLIYPPSIERADDFPYSSRASNLKQVLFFDQTSWLPDNLLERGDRMMMAGGIEGRMPFMDIELADLVAKLPDQLLLGAKGGKAILRRTMSHMLPPGVVNRKKIGFRVPVGEWFKTSLKDFTADHLLSSDSFLKTVTHTDRIRKLFDEHVSGKRNHEKLLWALLNFEVFGREFAPSLGQ